MSKRPRLLEIDHLELVKYIYYHQKVHGSSPSIREMKKHLKLKSHSAVQRRLDMLIEMGYAEKRPGITRGIQLKRKGIIAFKEHERKLEEFIDEWKAMEQASRVPV